MTPILECFLLEVTIAEIVTPEMRRKALSLLGFTGTGILFREQMYHLSPEQMTEIARLIPIQKITAIRNIRAWTGLGLKDAKDISENFEHFAQGFTTEPTEPEKTQEPTMDQVKAEAEAEGISIIQVAKELISDEDHCPITQWLEGGLHINDVIDHVRSIEHNAEFTENYDLLGQTRTLLAGLEKIESGDAVVLLK